MASDELKDELKCTICMSFYTDPVSLGCGHNFCRSCIVTELDSQEAAGGHFCPDCKVQFPERPPLDKRRRLDNEADMEETKVFCTYCIKSPVLAVKSCLQCENSLCDDHLTAHNKTMDHILTDPTRIFGNKKCPLHKKVLEYYCPQDTACLCVTCCLVGKHQGHEVELLDDATEKKKKKLREYLEQLDTKKDEIQKKVQSLHNQNITIREKASDKRENISKIFMDIKEQLEMAEKKVLSEISRQEEKIVSQISDQIKKLEIQEDELSRKIRDVEEMCHVTDTIRLLQDIAVCGDRNEEGSGGKINSAEDRDESRSSESDDDVEDQNEIPDDVDEVLISLTLYRFMRDITNKVTSQLRFKLPNILLDVDTAENYLTLSKDLKTAMESENDNERAESLRRFLDFSQVLSRCGFSSGRHYWEVECNQSGRSDIGVSYPSIEKEGDESCVGENKKSWCLSLDDNRYCVIHNSKYKSLRLNSAFPAVGVFLDYEAGRLSFYELCDPIRHLYTFTASFTEPLHAIFQVNYGATVSIRS